MKRAFRRIEERLPSHQGNAPFELKKLFPNSLPLGTPPLWGGYFPSLLAYAKMLKDIPQHLVGGNLSTGNIG